jgi:hypothetical protein
LDAFDQWPESRTDAVFFSKNWVNKKRRPVFSSWILKMDI